MSQWKDILEQLRLFLYTAPATLIALIMHEMAHAWVSYALGDPTPRSDGRLTPNPLKHLDPIGTICLLLFHFGWARPVMVNPQYYKKPRLGMALTALAGPAANFILAFLFTGLYIWLARRTGGDTTGVSGYLLLLAYYSIFLNIGLGTFNLIPVPPLDGSKIIGAVLPDRLYFSLMRYERYGTIVLVVLLYSNLLDGPLDTVREFLFRLMLQIWL